MNKFLLICSTTALLYGNSVFAMDYNDTIRLKPKRTNAEFNNHRQTKGTREIFDVQSQNSISANIPEANGKLITELSKSDFKFEHSLPLKNQNWRDCKLIVNNKDFGEHRGTENIIDAENILARRFLDRYCIQVPGQFASAIRELSWFLDYPPEKKIKYIDLNKYYSRN